MDKIREEINLEKDRLDHAGFNSSQLIVNLLQEVFKLCLFDEGDILKATCKFIDYTRDETIFNIVLKMREKP